MAQLSSRALPEDSAYRAIFEASSDGLVINDAETGVVLEANPAFCQMHGYDAMAGLHPTAFIHPNSQHLLADYVRAIRSGQEFRTRAQDVRRDGSVFDVEVLGRGFTYQGRFAMLGVVRDVSDQVRAYQVLEDRVAERTREIERRQRVSEALGVLLSVVNSKRSLDDMLATIVNQAGRLLGSDAEALYLIEDHNPALLRLQASRNIPPGGESKTLPLGAPIVGLAAERLRPVVAVDLSHLVELPMVGDIEEQIADRGMFLEVVRRGPMAANSPRHERANRLMAEHFRSLCAVPLLAQGNSHGSLMLAFRNQYLPRAEELELIGAYASQAGLAIENARLQAKADQGRREADRRRQVAEGLRDLIAIVNSGRTLDDILSAVLAQADLQLGSVTSAIYLLDDDSQMLELRAVHGPRVDQIADRIPVGTPTTGLAVRRLVPVAFTDQRAAVTDAHEPDAGLHGAVLAVPLIVDGKARGTITLLYPEPRDFGDEDVQLSTAFADQAAQAIENARLRNEAEVRFRELEALYSADATLHRSLQLNEVLEALVDAATGLLRADCGGLWGPDPRNASRMVPLASRGLSPEYLRESVRLNDEPGVLDYWWAPNTDVVIVEDILGDSRLPPAQRAALEREGCRSFLSIQVRAGDQQFGSFTVGHRAPHRYTEPEQRLLVALGQRAALAIQNARLYEQVQQAAALEERQRLARELHDAVTQTLFTTALIAEVLPDLWELDAQEGRRQLDELRRLTRGALAEMRTLLVELRPAGLTEMQLADLLRQLSEATAGRTRLEVDVVLRGQQRPLPSEVQVALYRLAQEALNNVVKHAHARRASIELEYVGSGGVRLRVTDDGRGFDLSNVAAGHLGQGIMRERARAIGAAFQLDSRPGEGTSINIQWNHMEVSTL
jgi:two-component system nitrate/nitrite sensor histidine kinase NarX